MATLTNILCTNGIEVDIQSKGGALKVGTSANSTNITIGNAAVSSNVIINSGSGIVVFNKSFSSTPYVTSIINSTGTFNFAPGSAILNSLGDCIVTYQLRTTSMTADTFSVGVGPTSTPTTNTIIASTTSGTNVYYTFSIFVPYNYYLLVNASTPGRTTSSLAFVSGL